MSELKPNQMSDWHIDGVAVHAADGTGLRGCINPSHPDFPAAVEALAALIPEPFEWEITEHDWPRRWNGGRVERFDEVRDMWLDTGSEETVAFEQGRRYERERGHVDE